MKPTHYYTFLRGETREYKKFVYLYQKGDKLLTSNGVLASSLYDLKPLDQLLGREVEYHGATGVLMEALSGDNDRPTGTYAYTTPNGFRVYLDRPGLECNNEMVRVSWKTLTSQKTLLPSWVPFNKLNLK